ncbi:MAG TPA: phosphotransferase [Baekduia sp.]|nr:phosphotransferase [Baekduia sp.]
MSTVPFLRTPDELTSAWLAAVLDLPDLTLQGVERIGTGQMSQSHRVRFTDAGGAPGTVVIKLASDDPTSRATGVGMGAYLREIAFYRNLAPRLSDALPACHLAEYDPAEGWFTLVLEDIAGATQGDQIAGCSVDEARLALRELARVHGPVLGDLALGSADWLNQPNPLNQALVSQLLAPFLERYGDRIAPEHAEVCRRFVPVLDAFAEDVRPPLGIVHGDYRLDNLLFGDGTCKVVDWQTVAWGPCMTDVAYFIGGGLRIEDRRAHEEELVRLYHDELLAQGVEGFTWEACWEGYRRGTFHGILMTIAASMVVQRTDRGDDMFMTSLERGAQQVLDLDALALLPEPGAGPPAALRPEPEDEGRHAPGGEPLWNESWYFDAVADDTGLGVYVRLGRLPNQDVALYTACVCGPGRPSIMLVDAAAPLPAADDDAQRIDTAGLRATQVCEAPLQRFRVTLEGTARSHADPAAPLRGEEGEPVPVALDLVWETDGIPYAWRQSTRYEIPCRVTGTVRVGDEELAFAGPGQRDHSWGARDWWAVDWMWSALHLEDGTHTHAVGIPQMPGYGVGYVQREDDLVELDSVTTSEEVTPDGLVTAARIVWGPGDVQVELEPLAYGALRLEAPDGRVSLFPRAMCRVRTSEGRTGTGWVEWNRVQR